MADLLGTDVSSDNFKAVGDLREALFCAGGTSRSVLVCERSISDVLRRVSFGLPCRFEGGTADEGSLLNEDGSVNAGCGVRVDVVLKNAGVVELDLNICSGLA